MSASELVRLLGSSSGVATVSVCRRSANWACPAGPCGPISAGTVMTPSSWKISIVAENRLGLFGSVTTP